MQQLSHMALADLLPADHPLFALLGQVRPHGITIADHDLALESPRLHKQAITVQATLMAEEPGSVLLSLQDGSAARALDRQIVFRSAARSVSGMAAVLAHEVKNPLSGIRGAAQLLEGSVAEAGPGAGGADPRRGGPHPRAGGPDGGVRREADRAPGGQHPPRAGACAAPGADRVRRAPAVQRAYDPSLPPVLATATSWSRCC